MKLIARFKRCLHLISQNPSILSRHRAVTFGEGLLHLRTTYVGCTCGKCWYADPDMPSYVKDIIREFSIIDPFTKGANQRGTRN